jgi:hypothetical protein
MEDYRAFVIGRNGHCNGMSSCAPMIPIGMRVADPAAAVAHRAPSSASRRSASEMNLWLHTEFQSHRRTTASSREAENDMAKKAKKRKYGKGAAKKVSRAMKKRKAGTLRSGRSGRKVKSRKQAIAIGLSEARKRGAKVPKKKKSS